MFAITAITGKVGGALAHTLLEAGHRIRAVVRDEDKAAPWTAQGCETTIADMGDADALTRALTDVDGAFILLPPIFDPTPGFPEARAMIAVIRDALVRARLSKVVVLSTIGAGSPRPNLLGQLRLLEQALADVDLPITFLRAAWFMENAAWDATSARDEGVINSHLQPLDRRVPMIATDDVGRTAAELLLEDWSGHRIVELEAEQRVSPNDIAAAFGKALGRDVVAKAIPRETWREAFLGAGMTNPEPRIQMIDGFNEGWIDFSDHGAHIRKGSTDIDQAISAVCERL